MTQPYQPQQHPQQYYRPQPTAPAKSPGVAAILSIIIPGLGHLYTGNPLSAVMWFVLAAISWALVGVLVGIFILALVWPAAVIHAYISAGNFNRRHHAIR